MIILTSTSDTIKIKLSSVITTNQLECYVAYRDTTTASITPGRNIVITSGTNSVNLVTSPTASTQRIIDYMSVYNNDTVSATASIIFDANGTSYELSVTNLGSGDKIEYVDGRGFSTFDSVGILKNSNTGEYNTINPSWDYVTLSTDVINNNATLNTIQDITGLSFSFTANKYYWFQFNIPYTTAAATTGARFSINSASSITYLYFQSRLAANVTTNTFNNGLSAFDTPAASNTSSPNTLNAIAIVEGIGYFSSNGSLQARFASEVANSAVTAKAGAVVFYKEIL